jgi:hypothetical protein
LHQLLLIGHPARLALSPLGTDPASHPNFSQSFDRMWDGKFSEPRAVG